MTVRDALSIIAMHLGVPIVTIDDLNRDGPNDREVLLASLDSIANKLDRLSSRLDRLEVTVNMLRRYL